MHTISFPKLGDYDVPIMYLFKHITNYHIIKPVINKETIELGNKYSPNFVCTPFKYTLGTLLNGLESNADILIQFGGGCRYGYYGELQREILNSLGYKFKLYNLIVAGHTDIKRIYHIIKDIDPNISLFKLIRHSLIAIKMVKYMDLIDDYIRKNIGFELHKGDFLKLKKKMLSSFSKARSLLHLKFLYHKYKRLFKKIKLKKTKRIKVGIIGELYTLMEESANYNLEYTLASYGIEIKRFTNVTYLLFKKRKMVKRYLKKLKNIKYRMGADCLDNIYHTKWLCQHKYDGIIHIKSSFCTPEIAGMSIVNKIAKENNVPVIFFSFDTSTSSVGINTRIEAFVDMLEMRDNIE